MSKRLMRGGLINFSESYHVHVSTISSVNSRFGDSFAQMITFSNLSLSVLTLDLDSCVLLTIRGPDVTSVRTFSAFGRGACACFALTSRAAFLCSFHGIATETRPPGSTAVFCAPGIVWTSSSGSLAEMKDSVFAIRSVCLEKGAEYGTNMWTQLSQPCFTAQATN